MSNELSEKQSIILSVLHISSALLSIFGSLLILYKILKELEQNRSRFMTPYDRIILGLSTCDILASITYAVDQFLLPSEAAKWTVWAFGTPETCHTLGFIYQLAVFSAIWYNCILSYYFLLRVLGQVHLKNFFSKCELWMHLSVLYFPITAIVGYFGGWYAANANTRCWISDPTIKWIVAGIPTLFTLLSLIINNIVIYAVLRKTLRLSEPAQKLLMTEATTLMFLYVGCFYVTISPQIILQILEDFFGYTHYDYGKIFPLICLYAVFAPLQGFFNVFIYLKPTFTRFRSANPNESIYFVVRSSLFNPEVPQLSLAGDQSASNDIMEGDVGIVSANPNDSLFNFSIRPHSSSNDSS